MSFPRALFLLPALLAFGAPAAEEHIVFGVADKTTLVRTIENGYEMELDSVKFTLDGEDVPPELLGNFDLHVERKERFVVTDVFEAGGKERPLRVRRTFDELGGDELARFTSEEGDEDEHSEYESALEGQSVLFTWNEDSGEFERAFAEGSAGDDALLEPLEEDMDLRRFLPAKGVAEGDSWEIEVGAFDCVIDPGGDLALKDPKDETPDTGERDAQMRANYTGTIR